MAQADPERPASVLDASALLAHLNEEDGASVVRQAMVGEQIARLRPLARARGLSLADRACLALAQRLGVPVVTADGAWAQIPNLGVEVTLIREHQAR